MRLHAAFALVIALAPALTRGADEAPDRCKPAQPCWPSAEQWGRLREAVKGHLETPTASPASTNPYFLQDQASGTESAGWLDAWAAAPSAYVVAAQSASDVVAAVNFAREHNLRLVIKGTGHDYLGRSNAPDSLLVWTHPMRAVSVVDAFQPSGCADVRPAVPAVAVEAGARWLEVYEAVTVHHGRYVQGGGCTSVGAAGGFLQGGGFGSWSKMYGVAAASLLEADVVTADGKLHTVNRCREPDLFWALRGGGGGTFGVVTRVTLMTHPLPNFFGWVEGKISAKNDAAFQELIERFLVFYRAELGNEHWGEQIGLHRDNTLDVSLAFAGLSQADAERIWKPFRDSLAAQPEKFGAELKFSALPASKMWDEALFEKVAPDAISIDERSGAGRHFWWRGDAEQVGIFWHAYQSRWIPIDRFSGAEAKRFALALFQASRQWKVGVHFNKGQAGAAADAVKRGRETSVNPAVFDAAALIIIAAGGDPKDDPKKGRAAREHVDAAMKIIADQTPDAGSYVNETNYFEPDWQRAFWGANYARLLDIKRKYDPTNLFFCHHCVGSELARAAQAPR